MSEREYYLFPLAYAVAHASYYTREGSVPLQLRQAFFSKSPPAAQRSNETLSFLSDLKLTRLHPQFIVCAFEDCVIVGFNGTNDTVSLMQSLKCVPVECDLAGQLNSGSLATMKVSFHSGFRERAANIFPLVEETLKPYLNDKGRIIFTGHSLGGAVAAIVTIMMYFMYPTLKIWPPEAGCRSAENEGLPPGECFCIGFGSPVPGDHRLATAVERLGIRRVFYTIVNEKDIIPRAFNVYKSVIATAGQWIASMMASSGPLSSTATNEEGVGCARWGPRSTNSTSPAFGTYLFLANPSTQSDFARELRDRDSILNALADPHLPWNSLSEHDRSCYRDRLQALRQRALTTCWENPAQKYIPLPQTLKEVTRSSHVCWSTQTQDGTATVAAFAYNVHWRTVMVINNMDHQLRVCAIVPPEVTVIQSQLHKRVQLSNGNIHLTALVSSKTCAHVARCTTGQSMFLTTFEMEAYHEEDEHDINRNLMPLVHCVLTVSNNDRVSTFVYISSTSLPSTGSCRVVIRQTAPQPEELFFTVPNEKVETVALLNKNCKTVKRTAAGRAVAMIRVTLPRGLQGYAVCAEFDEGDVAPYDWNLVRCRRTP